MDDNAARYAVIFAADVNPAVYPHHYNTHEFEELALRIGQLIETRRQVAFDNDQDFYACAFAEQCARHFNENPADHFDDIVAAGQAESDSIAN